MAKTKTKTKNVTLKIDPNRLKTRDHLLVKIINGATKSGAHKHHRKEANKKACRKPIDFEE